MTVKELQEVIKRLIRRDQEMAFDKDIKDLKLKGAVSSKSNLKQLSPFVDQEDLMRVGGRLQRSRLQSDVKHPSTASAIKPNETHIVYCPLI